MPLATSGGVSGIPTAVGPQDAAGAMGVTLAAERDVANTNLGTLAAGQTWTGTYVDTTGYAQVVTTFKSDQTSTYIMYFSSDGVTDDDTIGPYTLAANTRSPQPLVPIRKYYRCALTNTAGVTANLRIETTLRSSAGSFQTRLRDALNPLSTATLSRVVPFGFTEGGSVYRASSISPFSSDTTATALSGGEVVAYFPQVQNTNTQRVFDQVLTDAGRLFPGETLTFSLSTTGSAQTGFASVDARWDV